MGLDHADDDVDAVLPAAWALLQHLVGLADAGRRADEDLQSAGATLLAPGGLQQGIGRRTLKGRGGARPWREYRPSGRVKPSWYFDLPHPVPD